MESGLPGIIGRKVFGLDTSCVMRKALTGLLLPSFQIISVHSRGNLWERVRREYRMAKKPGVIQAIESWSEQDNAALAELIEKVEAANESALAKLRSAPGYSQLKPRQQAKMYADIVGDGPSAVLMQMARTGKLDPESARKVVRNVAMISDIVHQIDGIRAG